jgi:hypothetical protein
MNIFKTTLNVNDITQAYQPHDIIYFYIHVRQLNTGPSRKVCMSVYVSSADVTTTSSCAQLWMMQPLLKGRAGLALKFCLELTDWPTPHQVQRPRQTTKMFFRFTIGTEKYLLKYSKKYLQYQTLASDSPPWPTLTNPNLTKYILVKTV